MSVREQRLEYYEGRVRYFHRQRLNAQNDFDCLRLRLTSWFWMVILRFYSDDVQVRAESLAYLTLFSLLPLTAGGFLIFNFLAQFGLVQEALGQFFDEYLTKIPLEHRETVMTYVMQFKEDYLRSISGKSGSIGIFALGVLFWIGLKTFSNVDRTLNHIWGSDTERNLLQKLSNFILVTVAAPLLITAAMTVPLILGKMHIALLGKVFAYITPALVLFALFAFLYRFVPMAKIKWKAGLYGAAFTTIGLELGNALMQIYFRFGTNSAYGKLAVLPLLAFWIYLSWVIIILGAQFSYLTQNSSDLIDSSEHDPSFREAEGVIRVLVELLNQFQNNGGVTPFEKLKEQTRLPAAQLSRVLRYLGQQNTILRADDGYALARDLGTTSIASLLRPYLEHKIPGKKDDALYNDFTSSFHQLMHHFEKKTLLDYSTKPIHRITLE